MTAERAPEEDRERLERICYQAMTLSDSERPSFLGRACGGDGALRREIESLLRADARAGDFLRRPGRGGSPEDFEPGARIGIYEVVRLLGEGGMSQVYLAIRRDDHYRKRVALKILRHGQGTPQRLRRFQAERQTLASLEHPNIARLHDGGATADGLPYFVMELIEGEPIDRYCDRHRLPLDERLRLVQEVCGAVQYAHRNLVVHRDLKPSNILVTGEGVPKLLDFGIAKLLDPDSALADPHPTDPWSRAMTPEYASPEQLLGQPVTTASDVYSLGVVLYKLLTGRLPRRAIPFPASRVGTGAHLEVPAPSTALGSAGGEGRDPAAQARLRRTTPRQLRRQLRRDLDAVALAALRAEADRRYGSARELAEDLERYRTGRPVLARRAAIAYRAQKFLSRHRMLAGALAGGLMALLAFAGALHRQAERAALERDRAERAVGFVEEMLAVADPAVGAGEVATVRMALDRGLEGLEELQGQPLLLARLQHFLARTYSNLGAHETAEPLQRSALSLRREHLGRHPAVVESLNGLGLLQIQRGDYAEAEERFREAEALGRSLLGPHHPAVADSLVGLGWALEMSGDLAAAEDSQRRALALRRNLEGERHPAVADSLRALAGLRWQLGDRGEGEALFEEALEITEASLGPDHPEVAFLLNDLGVLLYETGALERSEAALRRSRKIKLLRLEAHHPSVLMSENALAGVLRARGRLEEAEALGRQVLERRLETLGEGHPDIAQSYAGLAGTLAARQETAAARDLYGKALERSRASLGSVHPATATVLTSLGRLELDLGESAHAEELLREAQEIFRKVLGEHHWKSAQSRSLLGAALTGEGRYREAEAILLPSLAVLRQARGALAPETRRAQERVADLYQRWGRRQEAERWRRAGTGE